MSKINNGGLDQYGAGPFKQQQFGTAGVEEVKCRDRQKITWNKVMTRLEKSALQLGRCIGS